MRVQSWWLVVVAALAFEASAQKKPAEHVKKAVAARKAALTYRVRAGDTLELIAKRIYGSSHKWGAIVKANPGLKPNSLRLGALLRLPHPGMERPLVSKSVAATRALQQARAAIAAEQDATDQKGLEKSIADAERALMDARRAVWKLRETNRPKPPKRGR